MSKRLEICPRPECQKLLQMGGHDEWVEKGGSVFCVGKLPAEVKQIFKEVTHVNDYGLCIYTPKDGMIDFLINANDAFIIENLMGAVLKNYRAGLKEIDGEGNLMSKSIPNGKLEELEKTWERATLGI